MSDDSRFRLTRRKAIGSFATIGVAAGAAGAGTWAYFSDTEESTGNTIQAGTLDLEVGTTNALGISVSDAVPGQSGGATANVANAGTIEGGLSVAVTVTDYDQGDQPEAEPTYPQSGELRDELSIEVGFDDDTSDSARTPILTDASIGTVAMEGTRDALKRLAGGGSTNLYVDWSVDQNATNEIQGDTIEFAVVVGLDQREPIAVDAAGGGDFTSIQSAVNAANAGDTVAVAGGTYNESGITVGTPNVQLLGAGPGSSVVDGGGADNVFLVEANDVTVSGFTAQNANRRAIEVSGGAVSGGLSGVAVTDFEAVDIQSDSDGDGLPDRGRAVTANHSSDIVFKGITSSGNGNDGITLWYVRDSRVEHVVANNNADNGVYFNGDNNTLIDATANGNADQGIDINWYDDIAGTGQRVTLDTVVAENNDNGGIELHDNGTDDADAANGKLVKNASTAGNTVAGFILNQVDSAEVQAVNVDHPDGTQHTPNPDDDP